MANTLTKIQTNALADDAVTGAKIADDTVAEANMANDAISLAELKAGTDGQIITWDASGNPSAVGPGTDGQVLTSTGAGSPPAFEAIPAGVTQTVGTWTPADGSGNGLTFSTAVGHYVKTGSICTVFAHTVWPSTSASGNVRFSGLPFTVKNVSDGNVCGGTGRARWGPTSTGYYPNAGGEGLVFGLANTTTCDLYYAFGTAAFPISVMGADQSGVDRAGNICTFELTYIVE